MIRLVLSVLVLMAAACQTPAPELAPEGYVRIEGRAAFSDAGTLSVFWPGSGAAFRFEGRELVAQIEAQAADAWLNVTVDGARRSLALKKGRHVYRVKAGQDGAPAEISLTRRTGPQTGGVTFIAFGGGTLAPLAAQARGVLIFGDSITAGYGVLGADERCGWSPETEDFAETYAGMLARAFDAQVHAVAVSGRGLVRNWAGHDAPVFRDMWAWATPEGGDWEAGRFVPDAVLIALGTNDFSTADPGPAYAAAYADLLDALARLYPEARLYAVTGPMLGEAEQARQDEDIAAAITAHGGEVGRVHFTLSPEGRVRGCDWHPGLDTQARMGREIIRVLSEDLGWEVQPE